jgi:hypothetical protein
MKEYNITKLDCKIDPSEQSKRGFNCNTSLFRTLESSYNSQMCYLNKKSKSSLN